MAGSTPIYGFPYPESSDLVANYPALGEQLAEDVENTIAGLTIGGLALVTPTSIANSGGTASLSGAAITFTGVSSISVNGVFTSSFANYRIMARIYGDATNRAVRLRFRASGSDNTTTQYSVGGYRVRVTGSLAGYNENGSTYAVVNYVNETRGSLSMDVIDPQTAEFTKFSGTGTGSDDTAGIGEFFGGYFANTTAFDGFSLIPNTGTLTGLMRIYSYGN